MMKEFNIEERVEKAKRLFKEGGYNCCQAVVLAYNDLFALPDKTAAALSSGFGGGMGVGIFAPAEIGVLLLRQMGLQLVGKFCLGGRFYQLHGIPVELQNGFISPGT